MYSNMMVNRRPSAVSYLLTFLVIQVNSQNLYFWHSTDFHTDPSYPRDSCDESVTNAGPYGDSKCDAPYKLVEASVKALAEKGKTPAFIIYSGDTLPHVKDYSKFSPEYIISYLQNMTDLFREHFPNTTMVMALGNHDYYPRGQLPGSTNAVYQAAADMWQDWLGDEDNALETFRKGAYYTCLLVPSAKLRVVVTNTNLYLSGNKAVAGDSDPGGQFAWLRNVLSKARMNGECVHLVAHVPPGVMPMPGNPKWMNKEHNTEFNSIVREFGDVIAGFYAGHDHYDTLRLYYENEKPVAALMLTPAVTPLRFKFRGKYANIARNPSVRKFVVNDTDGGLLDVEQYYLNLSNANNLAEAEWQKLYSFKDDYGLRNGVSAKSLHGLLEKFKETDSTEFDKYYWSYRNPVGSDTTSCDCTCKERHICSVNYVDYDSFDACYQAITCGAAQIHGFHTIVISLVIIFCNLW